MTSTVGLAPSVSGCWTGNAGTAAEQAHKKLIAHVAHALKDRVMTATSIAGFARLSSRGGPPRTDFGPG